MSQAQLSEAENGKAVFDIDQLDGICASLGLDIVTVVKDAEAAARDCGYRPDVRDFTVGGVVDTRNLATSRGKKKGSVEAAE